MKLLSIACLSLLTIASISSPAFSKPMEEKVPRFDPNACQPGSFGCSPSGLPSGGTGWGTIPSGGYGTTDPCKNGQCDGIGFGRPHVPQVPKEPKGGGGQK
jgi:hypothetical protein